MKKDEQDIKVKVTVLDKYESNYGNSLTMVELGAGGNDPL